MLSLLYIEHTSSSWCSVFTLLIKALSSILVSSCSGLFKVPMISFSGELSDNFSSFSCAVHVLSNSAIFSAITNIREDEFIVLTSLFISFDQNKGYFARVVALRRPFMSQKSERISQEEHSAFCRILSKKNRVYGDQQLLREPSLCKSSLVPVSYLVSASKKLFLFSFKDTFSSSRSFGTIIMLRVGCPFRGLNTFNVLSRQLVRKYYFIVVIGLWLSHGDYISQAPKVLDRMLKKLNFWTIFKKNK